MSYRFLKGRREEVGGASHRHLDSASLTELPLSMMGKEVECGWCCGKRNGAQLVEHANLAGIYQAT